MTIKSELIYFSTIYLFPPSVGVLWPGQAAGPRNGPDGR